MMKRVLNHAVATLSILAVSVLLAQAAEPDAASVRFGDMGLTVSAAAGTSMLELRVVNPERELVFERRTDGEPISWILDAGAPEGEYRYEAVVVTKIGGKPRQRNLPGGFEVAGGLIQAPPSAEELEARRRQIEVRPSVE